MTGFSLNNIDRAPALLSAKQWAQHDAFNYMAANMKANFAGFETALIQHYIDLQRKALASVQALDAESMRFRNTFKSTRLAQLKRALKTLTGDDVDPERAWLYTRYREFKEQRTPLEVLSGWVSPKPDVSDGAARADRALDESKYVDHVFSISLWDAACANFGFGTDSIFLKPFSFVEASFIRYGQTNKEMDVRAFIAIVRELDFGTWLSTTLLQAMGPDGTLNKLISEAATSVFAFDLLEAYRTSAVSGVTRERYEQLLKAFKGELPWHVHSVEMARSILAVADQIPVGLLFMHFPAEVGGYSYFPNRPGGALQYHAQGEAYKEHFQAQLKQAHRDGEMGWFASQLPLTHLRRFQKLLNAEPRPAGLSWLAGVLYDGFHAAFPEPSLDTVSLYANPLASPRKSMLEMLSAFHETRFKADLSLLATSRSEADWQALKEAMLAIGQEVLSLLTTPVPGGVTGLNRVMQAAVFGSLSYSVVKGFWEASKGATNEFAGALADTADMLLSGWLIGVGSHVHRTRMTALWNQLGRPRKVVYADGKTDLWHPDLNRYSQVDASALDSLTPNAEGIYEVNDKLYAKVYDGEVHRAVEIIYDAQGKHYVMNTTQAHAYRPVVKFDLARQVWRLALDDIDLLSDARLVQRMLPFDDAQLDLNAIDLMLRITATTREQLERTWHGQRIPGPLADGVRRLRVDRLITRIIDDLPLRGEMPANSDHAVFALLTQLPHWPADTVLDVFDQQGVRVESYGQAPRPGAARHAIDIKRLDYGRYVARQEVTHTVAGVEQLFTLIVDQLPETCELGREGRPQASTTSRIATIREQIAQLAKREYTVLFQALTVLEGHQRSDAVASQHPARGFLPLVYPPLTATTTALIAKLHGLDPQLSVECLEQLLDEYPFTAAQIDEALTHDRLPVAFAEAAQRLKIQLRIDQTLDGIYHTRAHSHDTDLWTREFAKGLLSEKLDRSLVITEYGDPQNITPYVPTGPEDNAVVLRHYGNGIYKAYDFQRDVVVPVPVSSDSFYLAIGSILRFDERLSLGMRTASDAAGLRQTLGDMMSAMRQPNGEVRLWENTASQFAQDLRLPHDAMPDEIGLYDVNGKHYLPLYGFVFQVEWDASLKHWRFKHPTNVGVDAPVLEHNGEGAWRVNTENPLQWQGLTLLRRLRATPVSFEETVGRQIMQISNTDEGVLRQVHLNNGAPPPLLMDTWKRFDIEAQIKHFVQSMQEHYALRTARADIQLLLLQSLPGWPRDKVLHVVDAQGNTLAEYGADLSPAVPRIRLSREDASNGSLLRAVLMKLDRADTQALLGHYDPVIEQRMLRLGKKIAGHALTRHAQLFKSLYEKAEHSSDPHIQLIQKHPSQLPLSVIKTVLRHTTTREKTDYLDKGVMPPRVAEQLPWSAREVRLTRAYEGLFLGATATADSEKLTLHMLQALPGWPGHVAIEVRSNTLDGAVLDRISSTDAVSVRRLVKREHHYLAYSPEGQPLNTLPETGNNLLPSILHVLSEDERNAIGIQGVDESQVLAAKISDLALAHRANVKTLLGLDADKPWLRPPMNIDVSFLAYPLFGRQGQGIHSNNLIRKAVRLYPSLNADEINLLLNTLGANEASRLVALERKRGEYETMKLQLEVWSHTLIRTVSPGYVLPVSREDREQVVQRILSAWRKETPRIYAHDGHFIGHKLDLSSWVVGDLPALVGDFSHIGSLDMDSMGLYSGSNEFLNSFTRLRWLSMANNLLPEVPAGVLRMTGLTRLILNNNLIVLTPQTVQSLRNLRLLKILNLKYNRLGLAPDVSLMSDLRGLYLRHARISTWPTGVLELTHIERLDLRNNQITDIPQAVFEVPDDSPVNRHTVLHDNPLSAQSLERLQAYRERTGLGLGIAVHREHLEGPESDLIELEAWLSDELTDADLMSKSSQWLLLKREGQVAEDFFRLLHDMTDSKDYRASVTQERLKTRVWTLIERMLESTELRTSVFNEINHERTCSDGVMYIFDNLQVLTLVHKAEQQDTQTLSAAYLLALAKSMFRLRQVDEAARQDIAERYRSGGMPDEAEIQLAYRIKLARDLALPTQTQGMHFEAIAAVTPVQIELLKARILRMEGSPAQQYAITTEKFWRQFLLRTHEERFQAIEDEFKTTYEALTEQSEALGETDYERQAQEAVTRKDQAIEALFDELTRQAQAETAGVEVNLF